MSCRLDSKWNLPAGLSLSGRRQYGSLGMSKKLDLGKHKEVKTGAGRTRQDREKERQDLLSVVHRTDSPSMHVAGGFPHHRACSQVGKEHLGLSHPSSPPPLPIHSFQTFCLRVLVPSPLEESISGSQWWMWVCMRETGLGIREPSLEMDRDNTPLRTCRPVPYFLQLDQHIQSSVASQNGTSHGRQVT